MFLICGKNVVQQFLGSWANQLCDKINISVLKLMLICKQLRTDFMCEHDLCVYIGT